MPTDDILAVAPTLLTDQTAVDDKDRRLEYHRIVLERAGIDDLAALDVLVLSGAVVAEPRIVSPAAAGPALGVQPVSAFMPSGSRITPSFVQAGLPAGTAVTQVNVPVAYFVASVLTLADDTVVVLRQPHKYVVFIAREIVVGANVTFTYELPLQQSANPDVQQGLIPEQPGQAPMTNHLGGETGDPGAHGVHGGHGFAGVDAPEIELWTLQLTGSPRFLLRGQDGSGGGRGQDGGKGGQGSQGRDEEVDWILGIKNCKKGAGAGGDGGPGGNGGNGGNGGTGGDGGRLSVHAPAPVLLTYTAGGFYANTSGGRGGPGGLPGHPGPGGDGGRLGRNRHCNMSSGQRFDGKPGPTGGGGQPGAFGPDGIEHDRPIRMVPITQEEFEKALTKPALIKAEPDRGAQNEQVTLLTLRLQNGDVLMLDGIPVPMNVIAPELANFTVPAAIGGPRTLQVRQADGTMSNRLTFYVTPTVIAVGPEQRVRPGATAIVSGSGFAPGARIRVNGEDMPDSTYVDGTTMTFVLRPPLIGNVGEPAGTVAQCAVLLEDGTPSNTVDFVIDTLRVLVIGDSVAWGQGLRETDKFAELVESSLAAPWPGIARYTTFLAHSGATIGAGDNTVKGPLPRELPTSYPTSLQQLDGYDGGDDTVDYVLITAGLNDVNFRTVVDPTTREAMLIDRIDRYCRADLRDLLVRIAQRFPNATLVATGYFPILSEQSADGMAEPFLIAAGLALGGAVGAALATSAWAEVLNNCRLFHELSTVAIARAVDEANRALPAPRVLFADPGFRPENAALAPKAWLYGINRDLSPQDPWTYSDRAKDCAAHPDQVDVFQCERASVGHPNPDGALAYATAINHELARGPASPLDDAAAHALLTRFVPILVLHPDEVNRPTTVETLLALCTLRFHHDGACDDCSILWTGKVDSAALIGRSHRSKNALCNHVDDERIRSTDTRDVFDHEGFFLQVTGPNRHAARAGIIDPGNWTFYGRVMPRNATLGSMFGRDAKALQYWFLYGYNESTRWGPGEGLIHQSHEGDWEHVTVIVENDAIKAVWFASHDGGTWARPGDRLQMDGEHPIIYSAKGTHGSYPTVGNQPRPDPLPDDETGDDKRNDSAVTVTVLGERSRYPVGQEWLAFAGLWGELGVFETASGPLGPAFQPAWYRY